MECEIYGNIFLLQSARTPGHEHVMEAQGTFQHVTPILKKVDNSIKFFILRKSYQQMEGLFELDEH